MLHNLAKAQDLAETISKSLRLVSQKKGGHCPDAILGEGHRVITKNPLMWNCGAWKCFHIPGFSTGKSNYMNLEHTCFYNYI